MKATVQLATLRKRLTLLWCLGFLLNFALFLVLTVTTFKATHVAEAWGWFLPTTLPSVGLMLSITTTRGQRRQSVTVFSARAATAMSGFYLLLVLLVSVMWAWTGSAPLEWYKASGVLLGPVQGVVTAILTRAFGTQMKDGS